MATTNKAKDAVETAVDTTIEETASETVEATATPSQPVRQKAVAIDANDMIPVRNVSSGSLTYISKKTGLEVRWMNPNDVELIPYAELQTMKAGQPAFLTRPFCIIEDEQVVDAMGLRNTYETFVAIKDVGEFFRLPVDQMEAQIKIAPKGIKETIAQHARTLVEMGQLDSVRIIKMLERELTVDLLAD